MKIGSNLTTSCCTALERLMKTVDPAQASPEHVSNAFHALMGWDPQSLTEQDFDPSAVEAVEITLREATRTIAILGHYFAGDLT